MLTLCGCASWAPQGATPVANDVPASWSERDATSTTGTSSLAAWWLRFNDPVLANLTMWALQANTSVNGARAALRQSRALRDISVAGLLPSLNSSLSAQHSKSRSNDVAGVSGTSAADTSVTTNSFNAGLDASWELDIFGANRNALRASNAEVQVSAASLGDVQVSIAAEVALDYIALRSSQARLAIASDNLASQQETLQITDWRLQAGLVTSLEAEQARAATEQTRAQIPALQTSIDQSSHALSVLTGQPPATLSTLLATVSPVPQATDELALSIPAETLRQRPDVRAAEHQVSAAVARVAQADAARAPDFRLGGSLGLNAATFRGLSSGAGVVSTLLGSMTLPLFEGGALRAQVRAQTAALDQARFSYRAAVLGALQEVEDALVALRGDRERLAHLQQAAEAAGNAALLARQRFSSGLVDFQTVLDTQRTQLSTEDGVASAGADLSADHVRLYKALGGGWNPDISAAALATKS
jgi:NodT family efflux transporter outer membrane factor (OMF) lipoprotein